MYWIRSGIEILRSQRSLAVVAENEKNEQLRRTDKSRTLKKRGLAVKTYVHLRPLFVCSLSLVLLAELYSTVY